MKKHSYKSFIHWALAIGEIFVFIATIYFTYLSTQNNWEAFFYIAIIAIILFALIKIFQTIPGAKDLIAFNDLSANIAESAIPYGLVRYFNMQNSNEQELRNKDTKLEIKNATSMWLCANSGSSYLDHSLYRHWSSIEEQLRKGIEFRVVLLDPYCKSKQLRNQLNVNGETFDSKFNLANLVKLHNNYSSLHIRIIKNDMNATIFATDSHLYFDPYHLGVINERIENRTFSLKFAPATPKEGVGLYTIFKSHFNSLWNQSIDFETWLEESKTLLPDNLPNIQKRHH